LAANKNIPIRTMKMYSTYCSHLLPICTIITYS